jgi:hypothetical protein
LFGVIARSSRAATRGEIVAHDSHLFPLCLIFIQPAGADPLL